MHVDDVQGVIYPFEVQQKEEAWTRSDRSRLPRRVLLLLTPRTYRAQAFIEAASRLGIEVVKAVDMHKKLAEYWNYRLGLDYSNVDESLKIITEFAAETPLGAVVGVDDSGSLLAAQASKALGLPHNSPEAAEAARDKHRMRQLLARGGVQAPRSQRFSFDDPVDEAELEALAGQMTFPCVVKPLNLSGSRGVIRADSATQFKDAARRLRQLLVSRQPSAGSWPFLVEEYVQGVEVALEGVLNNSHLRVLALFDKPDPLEGPYFEETIYITPSRLPQESQAAVAGCASEAAAALGLSQGPVHAELRINDEGPWLIEIAGRSIGGLCSKTIRFETQASLEEIILRQAFGLDMSVGEHPTGASGVMMIPIPAAGLLKSVSGCEEARALPMIDGVEITARVNYSVTPLPEGDSYLGFIFASGAEPAAVESALREAHGLLSFEITPEIRLVPADSPLGIR